MGSAHDFYQHAVGLPAETEPGETFRYGPSHFYAFGELVKRKLEPREQDPLAYLEARIFAPIGMRYERWERDDAGNPHIPNGAYLTARDWAKLGRLVLRQGKWEGEQLVPAGLLAECFEPAPANPGYGLTWWLNRPGGFDTQRPAGQCVRRRKPARTRARRPDVAACMWGGCDTDFAAADAFDVAGRGVGGLAPPA
jgi:CubicO group peptidase (beta-lactamase class C family)